jgi:hypothetical protein
MSLAMSALGARHARLHKAMPKNRRVGRMREQFSGYRYQKHLVPWSSNVETAEPVLAARGVYSSLAPYAIEAASGMAVAKPASAPMAMEMSRGAGDAST